MILQPHPTLPPPVLHGEGMLLMELLYRRGRKEGRPELPSHTMHFLSAGWEGNLCLRPPARAMAATGQPFPRQLEGSFPSKAPFLALALPLDRSL